MQDCLSNQVKTLFQTFLFHLQNASQDGAEESIHQFRVTTKKIRAIGKALAFMLDVPEFASDTLKSIRPVYKSGGNIRDLQVLLGLVREYEGAFSGKYLEWEMFLAGQISVFKLKFYKAAKDLAENDLLEIHKAYSTAIQKPKEQEFQTRLAQWFTSLQENIAQILAGAPNDEELHSVRSRIKEMLYVLQWMAECGLQHGLSPQVEQVRLLGSQLGDWHDRVVLLENLHLFHHEFEQMHLTSNLSVEYKYLADKVNKDRDVMLSGVIPEVKKLFIQG